MKIKFLFLTVILFSVYFIQCISSNAYAQDIDLKWNELTENNILPKGEMRINPNAYKVFRSDFAIIKRNLSNIPFELSDNAGNYPAMINLPLPSGGFSKFYITEYSMMEPELASRFPEMKTFTIKGIDDPYATGKIDFTMFGFHGMVLTPNGDYFIDPVSMENTDIYMSYYKSDCYTNEKFECLVTEEFRNPEFINTDMTGQQLRTYRLACAATGEYTAFFGGTVAAGLAAIVTSVNRVNGVYEKDVSVRMTLVANNNLIVYTNSATDPYTNNNGVTMLGQNQANIDAVIGTANYDIGHVFSTGGGGVAGLGVVCVAGQKARGVTGSPSPVGDPFDIDYVAHEMGHQYRGNHTFNGNAGNCAGGNRNASTAWEPGSGSTIMAYAGICSPQDLQSNSDAYFHSGSVSEIASYTQTGSGNTCPVITNTGNTPPTVTVPAGGFTIPINTPFQLTGSATDVENPGTLTYCWEEFDLGAAGAPTAPVGNAPIFRSFSPVVSPTRTFPKLSDLLNNTSTIGEILPSYTRSLSFRLTVRDNNAGGGGINFNTISFNVSSAAGPFLVTQPNTNVIWSGTQTVTWNVANTTSSPVSCALVNILLSTDGGVSFPTTLVSNTANDGTQSVTLPGINNSQARIKVESVGNIFFDISNTNFTIGSGSLPPLCEGFSDATFAPIGWNIEFSGTNYWSRNTVSGYGIGSGSAKFDFWNAAAGTAQSLVTLTFTNSFAGDSLKFDHAYAPYTDGSTDSLEILTSTNAGTSYTTLVRLWGNNTTGNLNTRAALGSEYTAASNEWATKKYSVPAGTNKIKFRARSGFGNNLFLDNICVSNNGIPVTSSIIFAQEGFYNTSTGRLNIRDTATVYLRSNVSPYAKIDSGRAVVDSVSLNCPVIFSNAVSGTYYIHIRHRNTLETWSKPGGQSYTRGLSLSYNFTTAQAQAYGNNIILKGTKFCLYSGDVTQEGIVDGSDLSILDNDAGNFLTGYQLSDLTGDGIVDGSDFLIADNNAANSITRQTP